MGRAAEGRQVPAALQGVKPIVLPPQGEMAPSWLLGAHGWQTKTSGSETWEAFPNDSPLFQNKRTSAIIVSKKLRSAG